MRRNTIFLISVLISQSAMAEGPPTSSFQCGKGLSPLETVVCSNPQLTTLASELDKKLTELKRENPQDIEFLTKGHEQWLKSRVQCSYDGKDELPADDKKQNYITCLQHRYEQRIKLLSYPEFWPPFRESNVEKAITRLRTMGPEDVYAITTDENRDTISEFSCRFFEKDPVAASQTFAAYFGSSMDGWTPLCRTIDIADRVPEVKKLITAIGPIWGESTTCEGTMRFAYGRTEMILRILAAGDPNPMKHEKESQYDWSALGYSPDLKHWSQQGNWEKRQYEALQPILNDAQAALAQYYSKRFHVSDTQAQRAAEFHLAQIVGHYSGHSGASSTGFYMSLCFGTNDLDMYLKTHALPVKACPNDVFEDRSKEATLRRFLGLAIVNNYPIEALKQLIRDGAELEPKHTKFNTRTINDAPLMLAAPNPAIIRLLLEAGAKVNTQNAFGKTALMYAIQERNLESVSLLLDAHADVNLATNEDISCSALKAGKRTPLMYAAWQSTPEIISALVNAHADVSAKDSNGETAANYLSRNDTLTTKEREIMGQLLKSSSN